MRPAALVTSGVEATSLPHRDRALLGAQFFSQFAPIHWSDLLAVDIRVHSKRSPPREAMEPNPLNEPLTEFLSRHGDSLRQTVNLGNCGNYGCPPRPHRRRRCPLTSYRVRKTFKLRCNPAEYVLAASGKTG